MNIRQAILETAALIEHQPELFDFNRIDVPECGSPGCLIGWVAHFQGAQKGQLVHGICANVLGVEYHVFYDRMSAIRAAEPQLRLRAWTSSAHSAATCLRRYADLYHPAKRDGIPTAVRAIFDRAIEIA